MCIITIPPAAPPAAVERAPQIRWYDTTLNNLRTEGLLPGYTPNPEFGHKLTHTRYEAAIAATRAIKVLLSSPVGSRYGIAEIDAVRRMTIEFKPEMIQLGFHTDQQLCAVTNREAMEFLRPFVRFSTP